MSDDSPVQPLAEEEARESVSRWSAKKFFRLKNMGDKIFIDTITPGAAYAIRLATHYEQRNVRQASVPYRGGAVDDRGRAPGVWDIPVARPGAFEERTQTVPVPHTERVSMCAACTGKGRVSCVACAGRGQTTCPFCMGSGFRQLQVMDTGRDAQGNAISMPRTEQQRCTCQGGLVRCGACAGSGIQTCPECAGTGKVKTFDQVVVRFQAATQGEIIDITPVPDKWIGTLSGTLLVDQKAPRIEQFDPVKPDVDEKAQRLLARSHDVHEDKSHILMQTLQIERIPLHEVKYKYAGVERQLWICGKEQDLYAPNAPWHRQRLFLTIGGTILGVCALIGLLIFLFTR